MQTGKPKSFAIATPDTRKRGAMLFDRIWYPESFRQRYENMSFPRSVLRDEVFETLDEQSKKEWKEQYEKLRKSMEPPPRTLTFVDDSVEKQADGIKREWGKEFEWGIKELYGHPVWFDDFQARATKDLAKVYTKSGIPTVPVYSSEVSFSKAFLGDFETAYIVIIDELIVPCEEEISWEQIVEFRKDQEALGRYRALRNWVSAEMKRKTPQEINDLIAVKLDKYEWALKKHGIKTVLEATKQVLSLKTILAALAGGGMGGSVTGDPETAAITGLITGLFSAVSNVSIKIAEIKLEKEDILKNNPEIALIYEAKIRFGNK